MLKPYYIWQLCASSYAAFYIYRRYRGVPKPQSGILDLPRGKSGCKISGLPATAPMQKSEIFAALTATTRGLGAYFGSTLSQRYKIALPLI